MRPGSSNTGIVTMLAALDGGKTDAGNPRPRGRVGAPCILESCQLKAARREVWGGTVHRTLSDCMPRDSPPGAALFLQGATESWRGLGHLQALTVVVPA